MKLLNPPIQYRAQEIGGEPLGPEPGEDGSCLTPHLQHALFHWRLLSRGH